MCHFTDRANHVFAAGHRMRCSKHRCSCARTLRWPVGVAQRPRWCVASRYTRDPGPRKAAHGGGGRDGRRLLAAKKDEKILSVGKLKGQS